MSGPETTPPQVTTLPQRTNTLRRTRFVCIADSHNHTVKLPKGDVLIHAGDLTNGGSPSEICKALDWLERADFEIKIVIAGNHDVALDQSPQDHYTESRPSIRYLVHEPARIQLRHPSGPQTTFTVFGSPFTPRRGPNWAFAYDSPSTQAHVPNGGQSIWDAIPQNTDILITHTPPFSFRDRQTFDDVSSNVGCEILGDAVRRVRPRMVVCGHVHQGRGAEMVRWGEGGGVESVEEWVDPAPIGQKISLVDLTGRKGGGLGSVSGREEMRETWVVNCALAATSYPHIGGKRFNKPIVVDINLPALER